MSLYKDIVNKVEKVSAIGLGYVGMLIEVAFAKQVDVIEFDLNKEKIELYKSRIDPTNEVGDKAIKNTTIEFTANENKLRKQSFI